MNPVSVTEDVVLALATYLRQQVPSLRAIYDEFPDANLSVKTPSASIITGTPNFIPLTPRSIRIPLEELDSGTEYLIQWIMGHYEFPLQIDIWAGNKRQRNALYEEVFVAINQIVSPGGLDLPLCRYYNQFAHYHMRAYNLNESEDGALKSERRARIDLIADANAVVERREYAMVNIEINENDAGVDVTNENLTEGD